MNKEEIKNYLKDNLKLVWHYYGPDKLFIELQLEGEIISKLPFEQFD